MNLQAITLQYPEHTQDLQSTEELFPVISPEGKVLQSAPRSTCHQDKSLLHPVVHLHIFNKQGDIYLQQRSASKDIQPNLWDTAVGGHVDYGEQILEALYREAHEELGLRAFIASFIDSYIFESDCEQEFVSAYLTRAEGPFDFDPKEIQAGRFWTMEEVEASLGKGIFTPNFESEWQRLHLAQKRPLHLLYPTPLPVIDETKDFLPVINPHGKVLMPSLRSMCHDGPYLLHPVVHLHILNTQGEILLQKRSLNKGLYPGLWDMAVGGHVDYGEQIIEALLREAKEELGLGLFQPVMLYDYMAKSPRELKQVSVFYTQHDGPFKADPFEISEIRFWKKEEIEAQLGTGIFTEGFENEWPRIKNRL